MNAQQYLKELKVAGDEVIAESRAAWEKEQKLLKAKKNGTQSEQDALFTLLLLTSTQENANG